ncbi:hypothetical protein DH2020_019859 [Rehmannia glutinosa]|uniref:Magnesium transporter n=1 Tax=Rehmannia glutinosa TaxID=99300 RepID=A0ABR0WIN3_REHGL
MTGREDGYLMPADPPNAIGGLKKKGVGSRSWILMDSSGEELVLDVDKYAIMHRVQIHARDLRILDPLLSYPSAILGLEDLRRRLKPVNGNREVNGDGKELALHHDVDTGEEDDSPFEFRALEVALEAICSYLSARTIELETAVYPALDMLTSKVRDELEQLLDDDDDMADLYLSRKLAGSKISKASRASIATVSGNENDVEELEMLLELREYIDNTEDYINIQLELILSSGTVCISIYSLIAGIFGMNIPYTWNERHGYMFKWVVILTGVFCAILFVLIISYARLKGLIGS